MRYDRDISNIRGKSDNTASFCECHGCLHLGKCMAAWPVLTSNAVGAIWGIMQDPRKVQKPDHDSMQTAALPGL